MVSFQDGLEQGHTRIAAFTLQSQYFYLSWGKSSNKSDLFIGTYTMREDRAPRFERRKHFQIPARVAMGGTETQSIKVADGFKM